MKLPQRHALTLLFTLACSTASATDAALLGVSQLSLRIDSLPRDVERYGLTEAGLQNALTEVLPTLRDTPAGAHDAIVLKVDLSSAGGYGYYSYALRLQVERPLAVQGDAGAYVPRVVWSTGSQGVLLPQELQRLNGETSKLGQLLAKALAP
jgi:hypothetical protein